MTCRATITITGLAVVFVGMTSLIHPVPKLIWNASAGVPIGLYAAKPASVHYVGDLVVAGHRKRSQPSSKRAAIWRETCRS
jgi:type IV secretory pathway protease TraF